LLGSRAFIDEAKVWFRRQGGHVFRRSPYVVAAAMHFDARLAAMPAWLARTRWLYEELRAFPQLRPNPAEPQVNMLHIHVPMAREALVAARDCIAREQGIWLFGGANHAALPGHSYFEWYVGENLMEASDEQVRSILKLLADAVAAG
jgi:threonine aldolase